MKGGDVLADNLRDPEVNSSFFALLYTTVRGLREPLRKAVEDEFKSLDDKSQRLYAFVSLLQFLLLKPWTGITARSAGMDSDALVSGMKGRLAGVVMYREGSTVLNTPNRQVADIIADIAFTDPADRYLALREIIKSVEPGALEEVELLHKILADQGRFDSLSYGFKVEQKVDLYRAAIGKVPSRPLYLHLAMAQTTARKFDDARESLIKAMTAHVEDFHEIDQHVYDTEGRLELAFAEDAMEKGEPTEVVLEHLAKAEDKFNRAIISPSQTPHSFQGLGKTYVMFSELAATDPERWQYLLFAIQYLVFAENTLGEGVNRDISNLKFDVLRKLEGEKLTQAKVDEISNVLGRANGYAFMAVRAIDQVDWSGAEQLVEKGLGLDRKNLWLIRLHVQLVKARQPGDYDALRKALADYEAQTAVAFDLTLTFELAMLKYVDGKSGEGDTLFAQLGEKARGYPGFMTPREENRWKESGRKPRKFRGTLVELPSGPRYTGLVDCPDIRRRIAVRRLDIEYVNPKPGDKVWFEIIFNMKGPQASRVREI